MHFEVSREIARPVERVWPILIDAKRLLDGNFGILKLDGKIEPGGKIKLWSEANPARAFPLRVSVFEPHRRMVWVGGMPFGLFKGVRRFELAISNNGCTFNMREDYSGLLLGVIRKSIPDLQPSFEKFADALKRMAEGTE